MRPSKRTTLISLAAVSALTLSSCGLYGGDDDASGEAAAQGITEDTIKIGMFAPLSGDAAVYGKGHHSMEAIYREVNENGGINGRQLELVIEDDKCDPTTATLAVKKFIEEDKVFFIHGGMCSNAVIAALPDIQKAGIPYLVEAAATAVPTNPPSRNIFTPWVSQPSNTQAMADFIADRFKNTGESKIAIVSQRDDWGTGWLNFFKTDLEEAAEAAGVEYEIVLDEEIQPEVTDATAPVRQIRNAEPDIAVVFAYPQPMSVFLRDAEAQGLDLPIITANNVQLEEQVSFIGRRSAVEPLTNVYCFQAPIDDPVFDPYRERLAKYFPNDDFDANAMLGVVGAEIVVKVLEDLGDDLTWDSFIEGMEKIEGFESPLAPSPASFGPFDPNDPGTRTGSETCRLSTLDPNSDENVPVVFAPSWEDYLAIGGKK
jgi:branched-chain amino acid transport system substrate-binding protein